MGFLKRAVLLAAFLLALAAGASAVASAVASATASAAYEENFDYESLGLQELDADGFLSVQLPEASFEYKTEVFAPEKIPLLGLGPFTPRLRVRMQVRNLTGLLALAKLESFRFSEGAGEVFEGGAYLVRGEEGKPKSFRVEYQWPLHSLLGEAFGDMKFNGPFVANGQRLNSFTLLLPKDSKAGFFRDAGNTGNVFPLSLQSAFYYHHLQGAFSYEAAGSAWLRFLLAGLALLAAMAAVSVRQPRGFPGARARDFLLGLALSLLLVLQLAAFVQGNPLTLVLDDTGVFKTGNGVVNASDVAFHLVYALARVGSFGQVVIGQTTRCGADYGFLQPVYAEVLHSVQRAYFLPEALESPCTAGFLKRFEAKDAGPLTPAEFGKIVQETPAPQGLLPAVMFMLLNALAFFGVAAVSAAALEVRHLKDFDGYKKLLAAGLAAGALVSVGLLLAGFEAGLPLTYHGGRGLGFTLASNAWAGVLGEGHSLALAAGLLGACVVFLCHPRRLSLRTALAVLAIVLFLFALPQTSYVMKRNALSLACGECLRDETDAGLSLALVKLVGPLSQGRAWELAQKGIDADAEKFFGEIGRLRYQGRREEALALLREFARNNPGKPSEAESFYLMGAIQQSMGRSREAVESFRQAGKKSPNHPRAAGALYNAGTIALSIKDYGTAIDSLERLVNAFPDNAFRPPALYYLGFAYEESGQREKAGQAFRELAQKYPDNEMAKAARSRGSG